MKKSARWDALGYSHKPRVNPKDLQRSRASAELQLVLAGFSSSEAEVRADAFVRSRLRDVLDMDANQTWTETPRCDSKKLRVVSSKPRNRSGFVGDETGSADFHCGEDRYAGGAK